jgi:hypothetical protein
VLIFLKKKERNKEKKVLRKPIKQASLVLRGHGGANQDHQPPDRIALAIFVQEYHHMATTLPNPLCS